MDALANTVQNTQIPDGERAPELLIKVFDNANTAIAIFDKANNIIYKNAEMSSIAELFDHNIEKFTDLAPINRTNSAYITFERFASGRLNNMRTRHAIRKKDGAHFWADFSAQRLEIHKDSPPLLIVQIIDITTEQEARRNETLWQAALGAGRQGVWEHDARRGTVNYSPMWRRLRGIGDDEHCDGLKQTWLERLHPEDRARIGSVIHKQETGEDGYDTLEYRERHRDGHYIWILSRGKPIEWDENGTPIRSVGTDTDITHLKSIEAELALEKERLQVTLQSIADGVISTDAHGRVTFINKAAERLTRWKMEDALGQPIEIVFDSRVDGDDDTPTASVANCLEHGRPYRVSGFSLLRARNSRARYIRELASPVRTEDGDVIGAVMVFRDATQRRRKQRELEYSATHDRLTSLANRVAFEAALQANVEEAISEKTQHTLCLLDLDFFKAVNDSAGHTAGDALLKEIAALLKASCRHSDLVARLGGDEFGILLKNCSLKMARQLMQKTVDRISEFRFVWQEDEFRIGVSIGITAIDGSPINASELYRSADSACYAAKRNGRGCVVVHG